MGVSCRCLLASCAPLEQQVHVRVSSPPSSAHHAHLVMAPVLPAPHQVPGVRHDGAVSRGSHGFKVRGGWRRTCGAAARGVVDLGFRRTCGAAARSRLPACQRGPRHLTGRRLVLPRETGDQQRLCAGSIVAGSLQLDADGGGGPTAAGDLLAGRHAAQEPVIPVQLQSAAGAGRSRCGDPGTGVKRRASSERCRWPRSLLPKPSTLSPGDAAAPRVCPPPLSVRGRALQHAPEAVLAPDPGARAAGQIHQQPEP